MLELNSLSKSFNALRVLDNVSLSFNNGITAIAGANGSGKSTLLKILTGLLKPDEGSIKYKSDIVNTEGPQWRSKIGYLPQKFGLYNRMTVYDLLDYMLLLSSIKERNIRKEKIHYFAEELNLNSYLKTPCGYLSGGVMQRVGITHAMIHDPEIIFLDEPANNLDAEERERFHCFLNKIKHSKTILYVGHIIEEMCYVSDDIIIFNRGKVAFHGTPSLLLTKYKSSVKQIFVGKDHEIDISPKNILRIISVDDKTVRVIFKAEESDISADPAEAHFEDIYKIVTRN